MDWASSQWKEGLSSIALQKISALEEKIEKLQKERQQKQHQFDCLELTLNKEKRKVEEEKQQTARLERELQSLADACKSFENKQQKFLADVQNRDSRINNLESQLSQAKKQNSRLQQFENDIEELRCLKESAKLENRQLEEKLIKEQDTIVKQSDAISGLEQTVRSLQEKCSNTENSALLNVTDKENINILNISSKDNLASESLRKKVQEQENTIKSLQEELTRISGSKEKLSISINESFTTPAKGKNASKDTSVSSAKKSFSYWDNFGSTPAKSGKFTKHINDSSSINNESDEKVHSLQLKLKQMCQELECQRHNFEATKNVMEQRFKEKENALKTEVKQQSQTIFDLDKELKEIKNKYQQDVVQGSKKLDVVNMQLQKSELSKQQMEKDMKALEVQMNSRNSSLQQKEEELKDVLKLKNSLEVSTKSLQIEKRELEKNYSTLVSQKNSLNEEIRDLKIHLDGSSNLVKEKESLISNMKKEQSSYLKIKSDLENKINSLNKDLSSLQSEKSVFEKQLQELHAEISVMTNNLESIKEEKKNICSTLDLEKSKSEKLKFDLDNKEKELMTLQSVIKSNELNVMSLKTELEQLTGDYNVKIKDMEQKLFTSDEEISHLKNEVQTYSDNKKVIEENITELRKENVRISDLFTSKESECESFKSQIENLESELQIVQNDNTTKHENICLLEEKIKSIDEAYDKELTELKDAICLLKSEKADLETLLKDYNINEESLKASIAKTETEKHNLSELLAVEVEKNKELDTELSDLKTTLQNFQMELNSKDANISDMNESLCAIKSEKSALENDLKNLADKKKTLQSNLIQFETDKQNLLDLLNKEKVKSETLQFSLVEVENKISNQQEELTAKDLSINDLNKHIEELKANIHELNESLCATKSEKSTLENDLKNLADKEKTLENNLIQSETDKQNLSDLLNIEKGKSETLEFSQVELEKKISDQQQELLAKDLSINDLNKHIEDLKANIHELNESLCATKSEKSTLENDLKNLTDKEKTLENNLIQIETDKQDLLDLLNEEKVKSETLQFSVEELEKKIGYKQEELTVKDLSINDSIKHIEELKANIHGLNESLCAIKSEKSTLENDLKNLADKEKTLENNLIQSETDKQNLSDLLNIEKGKSETLEFSQVELEKKISDQQQELIAKDLSINDLNKHIEELKANIHELNESLCATKSEKSTLENDLKNLTDKEKTLENNLIQIETDKQDLLDLLNEEKVKSETLQFSVEELEKKIGYKQEELTVKDLSINDSIKHIEELKANIHGLNESLCAIKSEKSTLENDLKNLADKEKTLENNLIQSETDKQNLSDLLNIEKGKSETLEFSQVELEKKISDQQQELIAKDLSINDLNKHIEELKANIHELNESLCATKSEKSTLENDLKNLTDKEKTLENNLIQIETDKQDLLDLLNEEKVKSETLQFSVEELEKKIGYKQEELTVKDLSINDSIKHIEELKANMHGLNESLCAIKSEKSTLENDLKNLADKEKTLENNLIQSETDKQNLSDLLNIEKGKSETLEFSQVELEKKISDQQQELIAKDLSINDLNKHIEELKANIHELNESLCATKSEKSTLENDLKNLTDKEKTLENNLIQIETDKQDLLDLLNEEKVKSETLQFSVEELEKKIGYKQEELTVKDLSINDSIKHIEELKANIHGLNESLCAIKSEKSTLENDLKNLADKEKTLENNLIQSETDKQNLSDLLNIEKVKSETLEFSQVELEKKISDQQQELIAKDLSINDLNKHIEELKENMREMNETVSSIKSETVLLQNNLKACAVSEESLLKKLSQNKKEKQKISELLTEEEGKCRLYEMSISDLEKKLSNLQTEFDAKVSIIDELNKNVDEFKKKCSDIEENITVFEKEKLCLVKDLEDSIDKGKSLEENIEKLEAEKQEFIDLLKGVKEESDNFQSNFEKSKEEIHNLQTKLNTKNSTIDTLNKTIDELKAKTCEISENIDVIKSENISLQKNLENCIKTEEELQKSLKQAEAGKQNMLELLSTEQKQTEKFQLEITELKNQVNDMEEHFKAKDLTILDLTKSIECHKAKLSDMDEIISTVNSEKACLENSLKECALQEKSLQNDLQVFESDKQNLSEQLTAEKGKSEELHLLVSELTKKVDSQQADRSLKETTIDDQNKNIEDLKIKLCNLTEGIASLKSERLIVENELNEMTLKVESLQKNLLQMETEKDRISKDLTAEKSKSEALELNLAETKQTLDSFHDELDSKNMNMELINKKLEEFKYHEDHLQDLESQLVVFREKEISLNEKINQLEEEKNVTFESLSTEKNKNLTLEANINEFLVKVANLESELKTTNENFSSITSNIAHSKETYELKLKEFETAFEVMKSQNDNLSNQIKDFIETETALKETMKMIEAEKENISENLLCEIKKAEDLQINIEGLKANLSTRESEISDRDKIICNLKTEVEDLRRTYEEEKHNLVIHIGDIKYNLLSMQDSVRSIYSENDSIQSDMNNLKQECQELLTQKACAQQSREEFLFSLLNQLGVIEKHVEALEETYEEKISVLKTALWNAELKIALQAEDYAILINEKGQLQNELISNQENIHKKEMELKKAVILKDEHLNCLKDIEELKDTQERLCKENYQLQEAISGLRTQLWNSELKNALQSEDCDILMSENTKLKEQLKSVEEIILEKEKVLKNVALTENELVNCRKMIEDSKSTHDHMSQKLQAQISDLSQKMDEISLIADERIEEIEMLKNEKSKLLEELKTSQDLLQEKETELVDVTLLVTEHSNCSENVKNLMEAKESLNQENYQLHKQISNLQADLSKAESKIVHQNEECSTHLEEKSNLLNELEMIQEQLSDKETALENAILIENEHVNCHKIIENFTNTNKILTEKNYQLQEQICDLKKIISEADSKTSIKNEELDILTEEKFNLLEELKVIKENLFSKERDCDNLTETKINLCQENTNLLAEISSVSQDLHITKERLNFFDNKLKGILLKCKDVLSSIKDHGGQNNEISLDLMNTMSSYGLTENKVVSQGQQMENVCDLVCRCLELLEEYIFVQSSKIEIPIPIAEIGNQHFQAKDVKISNNCAMYNDGHVNQFPADSQNLQTNIAKDLTSLSNEVYSFLCSFEERVLNQKDTFKFLVHHQLIECSDFQKMLLTLKFMKNVYSKVSYRKFALQELKDIKMCLLSQNQWPPRMASVLSLFSSDFKEDNDVNLFFEKFLLVNAYKNIYMAHRLKKALYYVKDQLNMYSEKFEKYESYLIAYRNIHNHPSHMPILTQLKYKIYLNGLSSLYCREKLNCEISCLTKNREQLFSINGILCNVKASTVPLILNCMYEFYEENFSSSVYKNLVCLIMKVLHSCCIKEVSFLSSNTIKTIDDFLLLVSSGNSSAFKNVVLRNQMSALGDLVSSLLGDLSSIKHLVFSGEQELQKNRNVLSEISDQLNKLKFDHERKQGELDLLQALLQEEKDKQQNLSMLTKNDCNVLLSQKEKLEQTVLEISKLCSVLKNIFSENCDVLNLQTEIATLSDTFCLCQTCLNTLEKSKEEQCNHVLFSPVTLIHFIAELFNSKSDLEKEVVKLEECKSIIKQDIMQLENDKSLLQHTIDDLEGNVSTLDHELSNFKLKYSVLENEYQNINSLYIESSKVKEDQDNCLKANMEEIRNCKRQYEGLLTECQKMKNDLVEKEEEISNYEKTIQNKASQYETLEIKCKNYESEIENLNAAITKLTDMKQKEREEINNSLINEMKNKIASLEKSNSLLNMTVENVEEELQTVYEEKQNIQKELQEKLDEVENLQHEITSWKNKIAEENNEVSCLEQTVQKLTKELEETEAKCTELLNKNAKLQSDVTLLEQNIKTYEKCIIERDSSIEENRRMVNQLREEILVITNEKKNLQINIEETEANFNLELQKKDTLLYDFETKLNQILKEKADLEKQISCLLISEEERKKLSLEKESLDLKSKELIEEIGLLRSKLENCELQAISDKKEKEKAFQSIQNLNFENEEYTKKLEKLKNELSLFKESNKETSLLNQRLQKELDSLKEFKSTHLAKGSTLSDTLQNHPLTECKCKGNCSVSELNVTKSEHDYKQYMTEIINVFITVLKDMKYEDENHKTDLISMLSKWENNIKNPTHLSEIKLKLQSILDFQFVKLQELESELYNLKNLICELTADLNQYCEGTEQKIKYNVNMLGNESCFEESLCVSPVEHQTYFVLNSYVGDLKSNFKMLELHFKSMKNIIINKDSEINSLKERCPDKVKGENEQKYDYLIMKNRCKLLISNGYRLEKEYKKVIQTNGELEDRIKTLEQEKLELNAEADEMAEIIKQQNFSEELENLYRKVSELSDELCKAKEKNKCLKAILQQYEDVFRERGINISAAQNLTQDASSLQ